MQNYKKIEFVKCPLCGLSTQLNKAKFKPDKNVISLGEIQFRECRGKQGFPKIPDATLYLRDVARDYQEVVRSILDRMSSILLSIETHPPKGFDYRPPILMELESLRNTVAATGGVRQTDRKKWRGR